MILFKAWWYLEGKIFYKASYLRTTARRSDVQYDKLEKKSLKQQHGNTKLIGLSWLKIQNDIQAFDEKNLGIYSTDLNTPAYAMVLIPAHGNCTVDVSPLDVSVDKRISW